VLGGDAHGIRRGAHALDPFIAAGRADTQGGGHYGDAQRHPALASLSPAAPAILLPCLAIGPQALTRSHLPAGAVEMPRRLDSIARERARNRTRTFTTEDHSDRVRGANSSAGLTAELR
jgi:hypothetical protein